VALFISGGALPAGTSPYATAVADLDGDGNLDLATANSGTNDISVRFGNGHGVFTLPVSLAVGTGPRDIAAGDIDGDGDLDLFVANSGSADVSVLLNNGTGSFSAAPDVATGLNSRSIALGDLNGDGRLDFVASNASANTLSVLLGNGAGGFANALGSPVGVGGAPFTVVLADLDGDGDLDIAVTNVGANTVSILLNSGSAAFTPAAGSPIAVGSFPRGIAAGDLDGDGDKDLVVGNSFDNNVTVLLNDGSAGFSPSAGSPIATGGIPIDVTLADFDGDHDLDIAVANTTTNNLTVLINYGSANFLPAIGSPFSTGGDSPRGVAAGDFNGDGVLDLVVDNTSSNTIGILINNTPIYSVAAGAPRVEGTRPGSGGDLVFAIGRTATSQAETVSYALGGTAIAGVDYIVPSGFVHFAAGQSTALIHISLNPDTVKEKDETVIVALTGANAGGLVSRSHAIATGTIVDDEPKTINGTNGNNHLNGTPFIDLINGLGGNDTIHGNTGNDRITGGPGADVMRGDAGRDVFVFHSILDSAPHQSGLIGGRFSLSQGAAQRDTITDFAHGQDKIDLSAIDANSKLAGNQPFAFVGLGNFTHHAGQLVERLYDRPGAAGDRTVIYGDVNGDALADFQIQLVGLKHLVAGDFVL
jgi:FG-GAP-like repeat/Peptidase M10 serralysin C terminal/Calx-beta domain/FG-GAP repeat